MRIESATRKIVVLGGAVGCLSAVPIAPALADEAYSLECAYTTIFYYRGQPVGDGSETSIITIDPVGNRYSENGRAWRTIEKVTEQVYTKGG